MKVQTRLLLTKILVIISFTGSMMSLYSSPMGWGEIYPFFTWKLYSQPLGTQGDFTEYRIYSKKNDTCKFERNKVKATTTFSTDEYIYTLNHLISKTMSDSLNQRGEREKLLIFVKHIIPNEKEYKIVCEHYKVTDILNDMNRYDTATVITF